MGVLVDLQFCVGKKNLWQTTKLAAFFGGSRTRVPSVYHPLSWQGSSKCGFPRPNWRIPRILPTHNSQLQLKKWQQLQRLHPKTKFTTLFVLENKRFSAFCLVTKGSVEDIRLIACVQWSPVTLCFQPSSIASINLNIWISPTENESFAYNRHPSQPFDLKTSAWVAWNFQGWVRWSVGVLCHMDISWVWSEIDKLRKVMRRLNSRDSCLETLWGSQRIGGKKPPCSFFWTKNQQGKKNEALGKCGMFFNEWSVDGCVFWHRRFVPIEIRPVKWKSTKGWIHKVFLNPCLLVRKLHIKHNNHLPQNFWYTESTPPAFSHKWKISQKISHLYYQKKSPKIELPHTRLEPGICIFGTFFLPKKLLKTTAGCEKPSNQSELEAPSIFVSASRAKALSSCLRRPKSAWLSRPRPPWAASLGYPNHFSQCLISCPQLQRRFFKS